MTKTSSDFYSIEVFFAYSREDEELLNELVKHLRPLQRDGVISTWYDRDINAGSEWEGEIDSHLHSAKIILLLISADFMDSDYCYGVEMDKAMKRHEAEEVVVIPVILRPVYWQILQFSKLQALPKNAQAVTSWGNQDEAFLDIAQNIKKIANKLNSFVPVKYIPPYNVDTSSTFNSIYTSSNISENHNISTNSITYNPENSSSLFSSFEYLKEFTFPVITINYQGKEINRITNKVKYFTENLGNGITLHMVYIPGGKFLMSTEDEEKFFLFKILDFFRTERPQHEVTIKPFYIAKFQITQEQWQEVASWKKIEYSLDPNPSYFKGNNNFPVEQVSWYDAVEFCQRLSKKTGREYRLPSEAQWEYACRAGTTTPFHFGKTITTDLANYHGNYTYGDAPKSKYRKQTTSVGSFPPNGFGLHDMHGNLWEWCVDPWHKNYQGMLDDGSVWQPHRHNGFSLLRGGSWNSNPHFCRSTHRIGNYIGRNASNNDIGFRVVCVETSTF